MNISVFVGFSSTFLLGILIFKGLNARHIYKSFGVKGLESLRAHATSKYYTYKNIILKLNSEMLAAV
jgi:hypothetical protein